MSDKKIRTTLLIEIETTFNDNESTEDTVRFVVDEDLKDKGYNVISTDLANGKIIEQNKTLHSRGVVGSALDTEFLQALNDLIDRKIGNEPTKERF